MDFFENLARSLEANRVSRRQALWLLGTGAAGAALSGCAVSPVTGQSILVGLSEQEEKSVDAKLAPQQFSQDYGAIQDAEINRYVGEVGHRLDATTHRPFLPYSYRVLNANYLNAYTFPAGSVGVTRGLLVEIDSEAQLAALLGHEIGHVNARHAAQKQGQAMIAQVAVSTLNVAAQDSRWGALVAIGSQLGASALLSSYSRDDERQADGLGQEYMVRAGYPAAGMTELHQSLLRNEKGQPGALQTMFATHPMTRERLDTAAYLAETRYAESVGANPQRQRFMDRTAGLRRIKPTIQNCSRGEAALAKKDYPAAEERFRAALRQTPDDYAGNLLMAKCLMAQGQKQNAQSYAEAARRIYPQEAQAAKVAGVLALEMRDPGRAYQAFDQYDRLLPGNGEMTFLKGVALEGQGNRQAAAQHYATYLRQTRQGQAAQYAASRLQSWGYGR